MSHYEQSLTLHQQTRGKWAISSRVALETQGDLSVAYTPGVARVSEVVSREKHRAYELTMKGNTVAIVSDGTAVLGLGNIGPEGALPVMEGKAVLFKRFADVDAVPIVLDTTDPQRIVETVRAIAPTFGGINLEDIAAPACFRIERELQDIGIPVFHDDQDGTAIVLLAALENAARVVGKRIEDLSVVINGAGAAGTAIARLLRCVGHDQSRCQSVRSILICDSKGIVSPARTDLNDEKRGLLTYSNLDGMSGSLRDALIGADVFIGVSKGNLLHAEDVALMGRRPIVFAMANPVPEITPEEARRGGAAIIGTGRSDYPNQVNNVLAFPGVFRGALDARATRITAAMKLAAAHALAALVEAPTAGRVLPTPFDPGIAEAVATAVREAAIADGVSRI
jgi:malate dehydrogenase (oxaloacetate-decarboxylating)